MKITQQYRLHPKGEVATPASYHIKDFVRSILLTLVVLREAKWGKTLDLKMVKEFFQRRLMIPESHSVVSQRVSGEVCEWEFDETIIPRPIR